MLSMSDSSEAKPRYDDDDITLADASARGLRIECKFDIVLEHRTGPGRNTFGFRFHEYRLLTD
jgi:hypothetical protein